MNSLGCTIEVRMYSSALNPSTRLPARLAIPASDGPTTTTSGCSEWQVEQMAGALLNKNLPRSTGSSLVAALLLVADEPLDDTLKLPLPLIVIGRGGQFAAACCSPTH